MQEYNNKDFEDKRFNATDVIKNKKFIKCFFHACRLSVPFNLIAADRTKMIDCIFENCEFNGRSCFQRKGHLQNVLFYNIKNSDYLRISGVIFDKVVFKGRFDNWSLKSDHAGIMINDNMLSNDECVFLNEYSEAMYEKIDWALDITEAEFTDCDLRPSIPAHLIRRNQETQILIKYQKAVIAGKKNNSFLKNPRAQHFFELVVNRDKKDKIYVAPIRNKKEYPIYMEAFKVLREEGIAELD